MQKETASEVLEEMFAEDENLTQLKQDLAELDSAIFIFTKTNDLRGPAFRSLELMRKRRASLETKIATYEV